MPGHWVRSIAAASLLLVSVNCSSDEGGCQTAQITRVELLHAGPILPAPNALVSEEEIRHTIYTSDRTAVARTDTRPMPKREWARLAAAACAGAREKTEQSTGNTFIKVVREDPKDTTSYDAASDDPVRQLTVDLVQRTFAVDLIDLEPGHGNVEPAP